MDPQPIPVEIVGEPSAPFEWVNVVIGVCGVLGTIVGVLVGGLITWKVARRSENVARERDQRLQWESWADEINDSVSDSLLDALSNWAGAAGELWDQYVEFRDGRAPEEVPKEIDDRVHRTGRQVTRLTIRISDLCVRLLYRPGAPVDDLQPLHAAVSAWGEWRDKQARLIAMEPGETETTRVLVAPADRAAIKEVADGLMYSSLALTQQLTKFFVPPGTEVSEST